VSGEVTTSPKLNEEETAAPNNAERTQDGVIVIDDDDESNLDSSSSVTNDVNDRISCLFACSPCFVNMSYLFIVARKAMPPR
jgi:hypothetical protein